MAPTSSAAYPFSAVRRFAAIVSAMLCSALMLGVAISPAPLAAQASGYYIATLAAPATEESVVARGVAWKCRDTTCVANKSTSRPSRVCRGLKREFGTVTSFVSDGERLADDRLSRCNAD